jgi:mono/diheme cytochrome c family protein
VSRLRRIDRIFAPATWLVAAALALMLIVGPELVAEDKSSGKSEAGATGYSSGSSAGIDGKAVFSANCGSCHTLSAANTTGVVGPKLDGKGLSADEVGEIVRGGRGTMPSFGDRLSGAEVRAVADFVARASAP